MNVDVTVNGRPWKVAVDSAEAGSLAGKVTVTIKGKSRVVDASWVDQDTLSLIDGGTAREIRLHLRSDNSIGVELDGRLFEATVAPGDARLKSRPADSGNPVQPSAGSAPVGLAPGLAVGLGFSQAIKAPMPGRIARVLVAAGDHVTARQAVVVIEAMKMENELRSPCDGVVKEVLVAQGAAVESGAVLVVVDHEIHSQ